MCDPGKTQTQHLGENEGGEFASESMFSFFFFFYKIDNIFHKKNIIKEFVGFSILPYFSPVALSALGRSPVIMHILGADPGRAPGKLHW